MLLSDQNKIRILYNEIAAVIGYYRHWPCNTPKNKCEASLRDTLINISLEKNCRHPRLVPGNLNKLAQRMRDLNAIANY